MTTPGTTPQTAAQGVPYVTDETFAEEVLRADVPVLVQFTAQWCPSCKQLTPVLGALAAELGDRVRAVRLDVDHNPGTTVAHGVLAVPTLLVFQGGEPVRSVVGARSRARLLRDLDGVI
ncbi:thioredoxin family protein [Streptomyces sp. NPDC004134]|uniref:thioredoxin family protein n=1 Tax=Streptomyces sp. NPDC004134 TaxID=3364691 RepID=UPI0036820A13